MRACDICLEKLNADGGSVEAVTYCSCCGKDLCGNCVRYIDGSHYCKNCGKEMEEE